MNACINCMDRRANCHSACDRYLADKKHHEELKTLISQNKAIERDCYEVKHSKKIRKSKRLGGLI